MDGMGSVLRWLPLGLLALLTACGPVYRARAEPAAMGSQGPRPLSAGTMPAAELMELGHWKGWGNGVRIDYSDGWTDTILLAPGGAIQWSWAPGSNRDEPPTNTGKAVRLKGPAAGWVGVYRFAPTQPDQPP